MRVRKLLSTISTVNGQWPYHSFASATLPSVLERSKDSQHWSHQSRLSSNHSYPHSLHENGRSKRRRKIWKQISPNKGTAYSFLSSHSPPHRHCPSPTHLLISNCLTPAPAFSPSLSLQSSLIDNSLLQDSYAHTFH